MATQKQWLLTQKQRKELARPLKADDPGLEVVHPRAAGIAVGNGAHYVAVSYLHPANAESADPDERAVG